MSTSGRSATAHSSEVVCKRRPALAHVVAAAFHPTLALEAFSKQKPGWSVVPAGHESVGFGYVPASAPPAAAPLG
jgi:hypothetical protein